MAQCKLTPREFISNAFSPQIAAICSTSADTVCQKNNLSFVELLQPFCKLNTEGKKLIIFLHTFLLHPLLVTFITLVNAIKSKFFIINKRYVIILLKFF